MTNEKARIVMLALWNINRRFSRVVY